MFSDSLLRFVKFFYKSLYDFLYFWYFKGSLDFWRRELDFIKSTERDMGLVLNLKLITQPIFGDYTYMGRIIGPIFRLFRVLSSVIILLISCLAIIVAYFIWIALPLVVFYMIFSNILYIIQN